MLLYPRKQKAPQDKYEEGDDAFHGTVLNLQDTIHFQGSSIDELRRSLQDSVEEYTP